MMETEGVFEYITRIQTMVNQLSRNGDTLLASLVVEKILRSLTKDFKNVECAIEESKDMSTLSVEKLVEFLEAYKKRNRKKLEPHNKVFQIK